MIACMNVMDWAVQTHTAQASLGVHDDRLDTQFGGAERSGVPSRPAAEHDQFCLLCEFADNHEQGIQAMGLLV